MTDETVEKNVEFYVVVVKRMKNSRGSKGGKGFYTVAHVGAKRIA